MTYNTLKTREQNLKDIVERRKEQDMSRVYARRRAGVGVLLATAALGAVYFCSSVLPKTDYYEVNMAPVASIQAYAGTSIEDLAEREGITKEDPSYHRYEVFMLRINDAQIGYGMRVISDAGEVSLTGRIRAIDVDRNGDFSGKKPIK